MSYFEIYLINKSNFTERVLIPIPIMVHVTEPDYRTPCFIDLIFHP